MNLVVKWSLTFWGLIIFAVCCAQLLSLVWLFVTPWTATHQASMSMDTLQAGILEWVAIPSSKESSQPRDRIQVLHCKQIIYQQSCHRLWDWAKWFKVSVADLWGSLGSTQTSWFNTTPGKEFSYQHLVFGTWFFLTVQLPPIIQPPVPGKMRLIN